ncbi:hypothetical protein BN971_04903 [Mycobacterium bohemicum DSM 44277]|uniref:Uncharacterized protein n=1 Tax=Mycobacterium bohemicum DSM 44277 TaxID=1236609 RepID=A0A0U0WEV9_MYCBE|nr:hypothetical protein BN971_04903 [Mycobacterium bohemicum DSM 44277]
MLRLVRGLAKHGDLGQIARESCVSAETSAARVAGGMAKGFSEATSAARRPAVATHSIASSASNSQGVSRSPAIPRTEVALASSSI